MPDAWEVANGLAPTDPADACGDSDGDGLLNDLEYRLGTDPHFSEPDPRRARPGLRAEFRKTSGSPQSMPDFAALEPFAVSVAEVVGFDDANWPESVRRRADDFMCRLTGFVRIPTAGRYTFYVTSDDGSELVVAGETLTSDVTPHSARETSGSADLSAGWHPLLLNYYENSRNAVLALSWSGPGFSKEPVPASALCHYPENIAPLVSLSVVDSTLVEGGGISLSAAATDIDGTIQSVSIVEGDQMLAESSESFVAVSVDGLVAGEHHFTARAVDDAGKTSEYDLCVTVEPAPIGHALGLLSGFYSFDQALSVVPDVDAYTPVSTGVVTCVSYPSSDEAWPGMPERLTDRFAAVFEGAVFIRKAGVYTFTLSSDDGSWLAIDGMTVIDNNGCHSVTAKTVTMPLSCGLHALRLEYFENTGKAALELFWTPPQGEKTLIPPDCLFHPVCSNLDSDDDGLSDWWEDSHGLNRYDGADADGDPDGDTLSNLTEFLVGTNPMEADTDGDGMPDDWEVSCGTLPFVGDALEDDDSDGLTNYAEYLAGTDPRLADSDGDGFSDSVECSVLGSDPLRPDEVSRLPLLSATGTNDLHLVGRWSYDGIRPECDFRGGYSIDVEIPTPGCCELTSVVSFRMARLGTKAVAPPERTKFLLFADGHYVDTAVVRVSFDGDVSFLACTPCLPSGTHTLSVFWNNLEERLRLDVADTTVSFLHTEDANLNGKDDWTEAVATTDNRIDPTPGMSYVSPCFIEGDAKVPWLVEVPGAEVRIGTGKRWFADVSLSPTSPVPIQVSYEGGMFVEEVGGMTWQPVDLFADDVPDLVLRSGDSLLYAGIRENETGGFIDLLVDGEVVGTYEAAGCLPYRFDRPGERIVSAVWHGMSGGTVASRRQVVKCVGGAFPSDESACQIGRKRIWSCPDIPVDCVIEGDGHTIVERLDDMSLGVTVSDTRGDRILMARLWERGPVLASARLGAFWAVDCPSGSMLIVGEHDGYEVWLGHLVMMGAPEDVQFRISGYGTSVLMEDFTSAHEFSSGDFSPGGILTYRLLKPAEIGSACHLIDASQKGVAIGSASYGRNGHPEETR